jgi:uncharacterized protein (TIGR04255 family)
MAFPPAPRVVYRLNPLDEVICQLRFTPVLKIDTEPPSQFQEGVRADYPFYESKPVQALPNLPSELVRIMGSTLPFAGQKVHEFSSRDRNWSLRLTRDYLSLTCPRYDRWESFRERLAVPVATLLRAYEPAFFMRVGLRYRDVIRRSQLNLANVAWAELLQPWITGVLGVREIMNEVEVVQSTSILNLGEAIGRLQVTYGLAVDAAVNENVFLIDADFFTEQQTEPANAIERLNTLNRQGGLFFRWCITDRLHEAMGPEPI